MYVRANEAISKTTDSTPLGSSEKKHLPTPCSPKSPLLEGVVRVGAKGYIVNSLPPSHMQDNFWTFYLETTFPQDTSCRHPATEFPCPFLSNRAGLAATSDLGTNRQYQYRFMGCPEFPKAQKQGCWGPSRNASPIHTITPSKRVNSWKCHF